MFIQFILFEKILKQNWDILFNIQIIFLALS
jgi:hypothetical protein